MKIPEKFVISLNGNQTLLKDLKKNGCSARIRMRAHAILLSSRRYSIDEIADIFEVKRDTVSSWIDAWEKSGIEGLYDKQRSGAPTILNETEIDIVENIIKENPRSPKFILAKIAEKIGKNISRSTLKRIIKSLNLRWKRIRKSLKSKRNQKIFEKAEKEIQILKEQQQSEIIDLIYFDECGFSLNPSVPYAYQEIGKTIEILASKSKRLNVVGFYNSATNQLESFCFECSIDSEIVIACFNEFSKNINRKTVIITDNASMHTSTKFKEQIAIWEKKGLFIKYLPAYSPELNLIEILWRFIKYYWLPFSAYLSFRNLVCEVEKILRNIGTEFVIDFA